MDLTQKTIAILDAAKIEDIRKCCDNYSPIEIGLDQACMADEELKGEIMHIICSGQYLDSRKIVELVMDIVTASAL